MRSRRISLVSSTLFTTLLLTLQLAHATPFPRDDAAPETLNDDAPVNATLELRQSCAVPCGWYNQLCCSAGQQCITDANNQAQCSGGGGTQQLNQGGGGNNGQWQMYTTTYVETDLRTVTSTYSSLVANVQTAGAPAGSGTFCNQQMGYQICGGICCDPGAFCNTPGECVGAAGTTVGPAVPTNSAFVRPTSNTVATVTATGTATTTVPFQPPVGTDGSQLMNITASSQGGLSPGAIAGIVIGVLFGLFLLFLLLAFLCCRGIWDAIFGRRKKRVTETYIEEHHHHGSASSRPPPRRWFGVLPGRVDRPPKKQSGGGMGLLGAGGVLAAIAVLLGLKRRRDHRVEDKSSYTGSSYTYSDYTTSESSASSDRRTRDTRRSRR